MRRSAARGFCLLRHYDYVVRRFGVEHGTMLMRKYACCYAQGRPGAREFRSQASQMETPEDFRRVVRDFFPMSQS